MKSSHDFSFSGSPDLTSPLVNPVGHKFSGTVTDLSKNPYLMNMESSSDE